MGQRPGGKEKKLAAVPSKLVKKALRGPTAYFVFTEQHRAEAKEELLRAGGRDAKVSVAQVAKALGDKWRGLSDEEKARYKELAAQRAAGSSAPLAAGKWFMARVGGRAAAFGCTLPKLLW